MFNVLNNLPENSCSVNQPRLAFSSASLDPLNVTQAFSQLMLVISLAGVPIYLALLMLAVPYDVDFGVKKGLALLSPVAAFLMAALVFGLAFLLAVFNASKRQPQSLMSIRRQLIRFKVWLIGLGALLFLIGTIWGSVLLVKAHL
jgi:hypothetical protein